MNLRKTAGPQLLDNFEVISDDSDGKDLISFTYTMEIEKIEGIEPDGTEYKFIKNN